MEASDDTSRHPIFSVDREQQALYLKMGVARWTAPTPRQGRADVEVKDTVRIGNKDTERIGLSQ